tara:strand:- start:1501 stop:3171 length:1671 start_codon:yes stop_codon:yes gene_type:complete
MAIKLDAKADAAIATAAARAGMGAVPKDMSKSFEGIAEGYASTMKVFGEYGAQLAQTIGQIAAPLVEEGISRVTSTIDGTYDAKGVQSTISSPIITEIQKTRANKPKRSDEKYQVDGEFDKTTFKSDKAAWRQGINDLYNTAKAVKDGIFKNITQVAAGDMNAEGTGAENMFMHAAVSKEGAKIENGIEGHIGANAELVIGEDGDFSFNFRDKNGNLIYGVGENGALITTPYLPGRVAKEPLTLKKSDMNTLIVPKNLTIDQASNKNVLDIAKIAKAKGADNITQSEYDQIVSTFGKGIATNNDFSHATNTILFGKKTYAETLYDENSITQEMFTAVGGENIVGLKDVGGDGISIADLTDASNMAIMRRELLNPKNPNARKAFNAYYEQGLKSVAADAGAQYTPPKSSGGNDGEITTAPFANNQQFKGGLLGSNLNQYYDKLDSGSIKLKGGDSIDLQENGMWKNSKTGKQYSGAQVLDLFQKDLEANYPKSNIKLDRLSQFDIFKTGEEESSEEVDPIKEKTIGQIMAIYPELSREEAEKRYNIMEGFTNPKKLP